MDLKSYYTDSESDSDSTDSSDLDTLSSSSCNSKDDKLTKNELLNKIKYLQKMFNLENEKIKKYCIHMENNFKINASCCNKIFCCSECHNLSSDHKLDIKFTNIICGFCDIEQKLNDNCVACDKQLRTTYYCRKCFIFDNNDKYKYHCDKCNQCHCQNKYELENCSNCTICFKKNTKHICINLEDNCSICFDKLCNDVICNLSCGHVIHHECYNELIKKSYKCPLCSKTILDMKDEFQKMDLEVENYNNFYKTLNFKEIYCNDCEKKSDTIFNYVGLKCNVCGSYNTRLNE